MLDHVCSDEPPHVLQRMEVTRMVPQTYCNFGS